MKKILAVLAVVAITFLGSVQAKACWFTDLFTVTTDYICAGAEGKATAADMLAALETGKRLIDNGEITAVDISSALSILMVLRDTGCFVRDQLKLAFEVVDAGNEALATKRLKALPTAAPALPQYPALRALIK